MRRRGRGGLATLRSRPRFGGRTSQVRVYDARGQARSLDPHTEPGQTLVAHAEELVRAAVGGTAPR